MAEQVCVCGHPKAEHSDCHTSYLGRPLCRHRHDNDCACAQTGFRPALPWPDAEGEWWLASTHTSELVFAVKRRAKPFDILVWKRRGGGPYWEGSFENARFTKLLEPNPFPASNEGEKGTV